MKNQNENNAILQISNEGIIQSKNARTWLRNDGILHVDMIADSQTILSDAVELISAQKTLAAGIKRPLLVQLGKIKSMNRDARMYLGGHEAEENVIATALVIISPIGEIIGNFFIGLNKTLYPIRLFSSEERAIKWLTGFIK